MATASPTPMATGPIRRTSQRQLRRPISRSTVTRSESQSALAASMAQPKSQSHHQYDDDSSEDEIPVPMKLSALTKALLNDEAPQNGGAQPSQTRQPSPPRTRRQASVLNTSGPAAATRRSTRSSRASEERSILPESPSREHSPAARKRVVRLSNTPQSLNQMPPGKRRSFSSSQQSHRHTPQSSSVERFVDEQEPQEQQGNLSTPAQSARVVRVTSASSVNRSRVDSAGHSSGRSHYDRSAMDRSVLDKSAMEPDYEQSEAPDTAARNAAHVGTGSISRHPSTRSRNDENGNPQGSMRVKRVGKLPGSFLSGPARRGRRQQSEEGVDAYADGEQGAQEPASVRREDEARSPLYQESGVGEFNSGSPIGGSAARASHRRNNSGIDVRVDSAKTSPRESHEKPTAEPEESNIGDIGHLVSVGRLQLPSSQDQENENPLNRKWAKPIVSDLEKARRPLHADIAPARVASPDRKPLASIGQNTPHRAAPPPPKMSSVLDAATASTGPAATTQTKQRRNILKVNGKCYTRLDCLGRGGCGKVYRVTGENGQMFALKRMMLENADPSMIKGFHLEIELMEKLRDADRVVNLFAHELNPEKQILSLVMEMGERDLDRIMFNHQKTDNQKLDTVFIRYWWKEMLECVRSVHQYDIVHSDLKPANFVLVQGQLKLIDFGIANAIQTDETVNVHRDNHVGTPNYMSPESLMDSNNPRGARMPGQPKLMRVGKPSDVWSLGCILYRMVYGVLPFGHMINHLARCQAIINWDHRIEFPTRATGGALVPPSLIRTMKRCLTRDAHLRPTCDELLHDSDPFLYPVEFSDRALPIDEELLGRIIQSVVTRCRERMPTDGETSNVWPKAYWSSIHKSMAGRM